MDPSTGTAKFKVPLANSVAQGTSADSWCGGIPGSTTTYIHSWPYSLTIAGDGYLYTAYTTTDTTSFEKKSATQLWPDAAYQYFALLQQDTTASNFGAAFADYNSLLLTLPAGTAGDAYNNDLYQILQANNVSLLSEALQDEYTLAPLFAHACDTSVSSVTKLHLLRAGTDGSSSDVVVQQWNYTQSGTSGFSSSNPAFYSTVLVQNGSNLSFNGVNIITNADQGAAYSWQVDLWGYCALLTNNACSSNVDTVIENHLTTTAGGSVTSDVVMSTNNGNPSPGYPFTPVLQLADGSYVGTTFDTTGISMVAFDTSGNTNWTVPGYTPQIATADGGIIASSGATFDANGIATGQLPNLPQFQSWLGNGYQFGSVERVAFQPLIAATIWSFLGGNPSGTGPGRPWYFILNWQNAFDFIPNNPSVGLALKTDITNKATSIKTAALDALKQAYKPWPIVVVEGTPNTGDHQAVVQTTLPNSQDCGTTDPNQVPLRNSDISYECNMKEAQVALQVVINNAQDESNALSRQELIQAIGRGIGNTAAHEIAHQFLSKCCSMDVLTSQDPNAAGTYNNGDADADPNPQVTNSDPAPYTGYGKDGKPIHWEATTQQALTKCLASGFQDYGLTTCAVKLQLSQNNPSARLDSSVWAKAVTRPKANTTPAFKFTVTRLLADLIFWRP